MGGKKLPITLLYKEKKVNLLLVTSLVWLFLIGVIIVYYLIDARAERESQIPINNSEVWVHLDDSNGPTKAVVVKSSPTIPVVNKQAEKITKPIWPVVGKVAASFGWRKDMKKNLEEWHYVPSIEISIPGKQEVKAILPGKVSLVEKSKGTGYIITIIHPSHFKSIYSNCLRSRIKSGENLQQGQIIAEVQDKLIFRLIKDNQPCNPLEYLSH